MKFATPGQEMIFLLTNSGDNPQKLFKAFSSTVRQDRPAEVIEQQIGSKLVDLMQVYLEQLQDIQKAFDASTTPESIRPAMTELFAKLYTMTRHQMDIGVSIGYCIGKYGDRNKKLAEWFKFDDARKKELMEACRPEQRKYMEEYLRGK
jgi:hypothetical protein